MKTVELICVGCLKFSGLRELEQRYLQMINYFVKFNIKNLKEIKHQDEEQLVAKEGDMIIRALQEKDFVIALDRQGRQLDTPGFARFLSQKLSYHAGRIVFLIGGFAGLSPALEPRINFKLSFSDLTFPHDLFRVVFLEQLYRAFTIVQGIRYHR